MRRPGSDIRSRWPTHGLRWWIRHTHVREPRLSAASGDREPEEHRDRPTRLPARTGAAHAAAGLSGRLVPPLASAPVRSELLLLSPANATRSAGTDAPDSQRHCFVHRLCFLPENGRSPSPWTLSSPQEASLRLLGGCAAAMPIDPGVPL